MSQQHRCHSNIVVRTLASWARELNAAESRVRNREGRTGGQAAVYRDRRRGEREIACSGFG